MVLEEFGHGSTKRSRGREKMLTKERLWEIGWIDLVYTKAQEVSHTRICAKFIRNFGAQLLEENSDLPNQFSQKTLLNFYKDITRTLRHIATCEDEDKHKELKLSLRKVQRHRIAYFFLVCITRHEYWWLGSFDDNIVRQLAHTHHITQKESKEFFRKLIADVHILGHISHITLRGTNT